MEKDYNSIAPYYDNLFTDERSMKENKEISRMLKGIRGTVLDIGCGTGLLVELMNIEPCDYIGIDPSKAMLDSFILKHPQYQNCLINEPYEFFCGSADAAVALFGSPNYIAPDAIQYIPAPDLFLMFYHPDYIPETYNRTGVYVKHHTYSIDELQHMFRDCEVKVFSNYLIVTNI